MDAKKIDLQAVHTALRDGRAPDTWMATWLPSTWAAPGRFRENLYSDAQSRKVGRIKSRAGVALDIYSDCVISHIGRGLVALLTGPPSHASVTYDLLHERCSGLVSAWREAGVKTGDTLAVVLPVGLDYAVALLTGLRMGLVVAPVVPLGPTYVRNRLARIEADHVVTSADFQPMLDPLSDPPLSPSARGGDATVATSHAYGADDPALLLFSPFGDPEAEPTPLLASDLHEALLRDSLLVWTLSAEDRIAAPGFDAIQHQPLGVLSTWIAGAAWVEIEIRDLVNEARLLKRLGVTVLGVSVALRELVLSKGPDVCLGVRAWYRSESDAFDYMRWSDFARLLSEKSIASFSVLTNSASGGAHLFSARTLTVQPTHVWPAPGRVFQISQLGAGLLPSIDGSGVYTPLLGKERDESLVQMVVAKIGDAWVIGGSADPGPSARSLPVREIAKVAEKFPGVRAASVVVAPGRLTNEAHVVLLVFVDGEEPTESDDAISISALKAHIARELGDIHTPPRVEIFPIYPRWKKGEIDAAWCQSQYLSGALTTRIRIPAFLTLSRLSWIFGKAAAEE